MYYDANASGPDERGNGGVGMMMKTDNGQRYQPGQWPSDDPHVYNGGVAISDDPPAVPTPPTSRTATPTPWVAASAAPPASGVITVRTPRRVVQAQTQLQPASQPERSPAAARERSGSGTLGECRLRLRTSRLGRPIYEQATVS